MDDSKRITQLIHQVETLEARCEDLQRSYEAILRLYVSQFGELMTWTKIDPQYCVDLLKSMAVTIGIG